MIALMSLMKENEDMSGKPLVTYFTTTLFACRICNRDWLGVPNEYCVNCLPIFKKQISACIISNMPPPLILLNLQDIFTKKW